MKKKKAARLARRIAKELFTEGGTEMLAQRLVLERPGKKMEGSGWSQSAIRDKIEFLLKK